MGRQVKKRPIFMLDVDGVLADFTTYLLDRINLFKPSVPPVENVIQYKIENYLNVEQVDYMHKVCRLGTFWENLPIISGSQDGVSEMVNLGFDVVVATTPWADCPDWTWHRTRWLKRYFNIDKNNIYYCSRKENISADVIVDDYDYNIDQFLKSQPNKFGILVSQPWNSVSTMINNRNFVRMNWDELISSLPELSIYLKNK